MAVEPLFDAFLSLSATNVSSWITDVNFEVSANELEDTRMGMTWEGKLGGLKKGTIKVDFEQDFAASQLDSILWPMFGTTVAFVLRPKSTAVGASNPQWSGNVLISNLTPIAGSIGEIPMQSLTWPASGTITRAVA